MHPLLRWMMARTKQNNSTLAVQIGDVIRKRRKAGGMTQAMLAEAVNLEIETVSRMENGLRLPTLEKLVEIANVFKMPVAAFFEHVDAAVKQSATELYAEKITVALDSLPDAGKTFVLEVAQNYARYHVKPPLSRKSTKKKTG